MCELGRPSSAPETVGRSHIGMKAKLAVAERESDLPITCSGNLCGYLDRGEGSLRAPRAVLTATDLSDLERYPLQGGVKNKGYQVGHRLRGGAQGKKLQMVLMKEGTT